MDYQHLSWQLVLHRLGSNRDTNRFLPPLDLALAQADPVNTATPAQPGLQSYQTRQVCFHEPTQAGLKTELPPPHDHEQPFPSQIPGHTAPLQHRTASKDYQRSASIILTPWQVFTCVESSHWQESSSTLKPLWYAISSRLHLSRGCRNSRRANQSGAINGAKEPLY